MKKLKVIFAAVGAALAFLAGWFLRNRAGGKVSVFSEQEKHKEVKLEIQNAIAATPASDLVDAAPNANQLRADTDGIAGKFRTRLRDRARKIISGSGSYGADADSGS